MIGFRRGEGGALVLLETSLEGDALACLVLVPNSFFDAKLRARLSALAAALDALLDGDDDNGGGRAWGFGGGGKVI